MLPACLASLNGTAYAFMYLERLQFLTMILPTVFWAKLGYIVSPLLDRHADLVPAEQLWLSTAATSSKESRADACSVWQSLDIMRKWRGACAPLFTAAREAQRSWSLPQLGLTDVKRDLIG